MTAMTIHTVEVNGGTLFAEVAGSGSAVVLIHPGLWDRRAWDDQFGVFAKEYRVLRYDARGYGRSSRLEPGRPYSNVDDLAAVMNAVGIDRAAIVGCSMGGEITIDFTLQHPERVSALVLVTAGLGGFEGTPEDDAWWGERQAPIEAAIEAGDLERAEDLRLEIWAPLGTRDDAGRRIRQIAFDNIHEMTMDESGAAELDPPAIERLDELAVPTLVMAADHDPPFMRRICDILVERIPSARRVDIPQSDHVIAMRRPAEFNAAVLAFLGEVR
jgi:pimeloyl-ACP methyl ester carboxylesterase